MKISVLTTKELRTKKSADLDKYVADLTKQQTELVHQVSLQKENKTHQLGVIKKAIARAKTIQTELEGKEQ